MVSVQRLHFQAKAVLRCRLPCGHPFSHGVVNWSGALWLAVRDRCGRWFVHTAPVCHSPLLPRRPHTRRIQTLDARHPPHPLASLSLGSLLAALSIHPSRCPSPAAAGTQQKYTASSAVAGIPNPLPLPTGPASLRPARPLALQDRVQPNSTSSLCTRHRPPGQHLPLPTQC